MQERFEKYKIIEQLEEELDEEEDFINNNPIVLEKMVFPEPVISVAVEPKTKVDQEKNY